MAKITPDNQPTTSASLLVRDMCTVLAGLSGDTHLDGNALRLLVSVKRLENVFSLLAKNYLEEANSEFADLMAGTGAKEVLFHGAMLKAYTKRAAYGYPPELLSLEDELNRKKKAARDSGQASKMGTEFDPATDKGFAVSAQVKVDENDPVFEKAADALHALCADLGIAGASPAAAPAPQV